MAVWDVINRVNRYIDVMAPWVLAKSDTQRLSTVMFHIIETLKIVSVLIWPFMPNSAEKMQEQLGLSKKGRELKLQEIRAWGSERPVRPLIKAPALFPRIDIMSEKRQEMAVEQKKAVEKQLPLIPFSRFQDLDLRIGTVKKAEAIPGSKKLLKLTVDGGEERTIVAGLAGHYTEANLAGKQVLFVANLEPVKLMGVESRGMVLAAGDGAGLHLLVPDTETVPGSKVK